MSDSTPLEHFQHERQRQNDLILGENNMIINRMFALDNRTYESGVLDAKTKEMMGLAASMVLRCDDCINYHVIQAKEAGATKEELYEVFSIALIVGGSIVIPHLRRAADSLDQLEKASS